MREAEPAANSTAPTVTRVYKLPPPLRMQAMLSLRSKKICLMLPPPGMPPFAPWPSGLRGCI
jgi:hypothetical protein